MSAAPHVVCGTAQHSVLMAVGGLGVVFYVVGIPLFFLAMLRYSEQHDLMKNHRHLERLGFLYRRYQRETYWWELALLMRRLFVSMLLVFLGEYPAYQSTLAVFLLLLCFGFETKAEPFKYKNTFLLDALSMGCLIVYLVCGMVGGESNSVQLWMMMVVMLSTLAAVMICACIFASQEVYSMRVGRRVEGLLRQGLRTITGAAAEKLAEGGAKTDKVEGEVVEETTDIYRRQQLRLRLIDERIARGEERCLLSELNREMADVGRAEGMDFVADGMHPLGPVLSLLAERKQVRSVRVALLRDYHKITHTWMMMMHPALRCCWGCVQPALSAR